MGKQNFGGGGGKGGPKKGGNKGGKQSFKFKGKKPGANKKFSKKRTQTFDVNARLCIRNLSFKTTEETLKKHFESFGKIAEVKLLKRPNGDLVGCGFVQYEDLENAKQAVATTNAQAFLGRQIQVEWAVPKHQFVPPGYEAKRGAKEAVEEIKSEPESGGEDDIKDEITSIKSEKENNLKKTKGTENKKFPEKQPEVKGRYNKNQKQPEEGENPEDPRVIKKARLIIRNISFKATPESLTKHFAPYGEVLEATLLKKPNGDLVGCGFVQFKNVLSATKAILNTNAKPYLGRPIHVDWAIAKNKYMSHITQQKDEEEYLKNDVKSEPESDDEDPDKSDIKEESNDDDASIKEESDIDDDDDEGDEAKYGSDEDDGSDVEGDEDDEDDNADEDDDDDEEGEHGSSKFKETDPSKLKVSANDAEDGRTVFLKNVPFSVGNEELQEYVQQFGEVNYSLVCVDRLTEHSKGTAFVRFQNKEDADIFLSSGPEKLTLDGQLLEVLPAMFRDRIKGKNSKTKKQPKDSRSLYLIKEGVILANSKAAIGVSASDMGKRLSLEQNKSQMLRNLNRFISRYRLTIHNVPPHFADEDLRRVCLEMANVKPYCLKECRVMKHLKGPLDAQGKHMSKGYGFVMFTKHEDALACLRRMNNNPSLFDKNNRPIVSFSVEDKGVINARKKRLEKSLVKNPLSKSYQPTDAQNDGQNNKFNNSKLNNKPQANGARKRKNNEPQVDAVLPHKKSKFDDKKWNTENPKKGQNPQANKNNRDGKESHGGDYSGETGKRGQTRMRSNFKLRNEATAHRDNVKSEKKKHKAGKRAQDIRTREKIRQPKQKQNTNKNTKMRQNTQIKDEKSFTDLVNKYKSKLVPGTDSMKVKSKWYSKAD